ncbi:unnamed protein product [Adineta steineri]|uniref:DUF1279 domain-containing protein n=1 Tax=Adineta steineri TaxID=433720 RepID=A0A815V3Z4_9BILA|nr:unnamed protein product [Adineta steineri]CAF1440256.1 unnamed protein product [Adineta steineri]CAF1522833.1 unnamed protein product [Adineta steineri]CAF1627402.1 unnamed protein product [Adineta steineri]
MWHLCRSSSRPLIGVCHLLIRQRQLIPIKQATPQRLISFPSFFKIKKNIPETLPQPPVNPRHPPDYIPPRPPIDPNVSKPTQSQSSIFARFRHAYSKYGKILLAVHFVSSWAWCAGLIALHFNGFDLGMYIIDGLTHINVISSERRLSFIRHMNEYSVSGIISRIPFISQERLNSLNAYWTGERVRLLATALLLYKFLTPVRYAFTLGVTTYISRTFLKRGLLKRAPQGDSLKELYRDQKQLIRTEVRRTRDHLKTSVRRGKQKIE